jgi:hypothetical protein
MSGNDSNEKSYTEATTADAVGKRKRLDGEEKPVH